MNKGDNKNTRRLRRKVKSLQGEVKILAFKSEMKDKRIETLERSLNDLEEQLDGKDEGGVGDGGESEERDSISGGSDTDILEGGSDIEEPQEEAIGD